MASSSVSQDDHDVEHDFAIASRRAKVRSARANRAVNAFSCRGVGEEIERDVDGGESHPHIPKYEQTSVVYVESNDASPVIRALNKDKRSIPRGAHAGKSNKGVRDRRKLREKRRSTAIGVMHLPSTESTGGSTGEDENEENSIPTAVALANAKVTNPVTAEPPEERIRDLPKGKSESDLDADADDEAAQDSSDVRTNRDDIMHLKLENQRLVEVVEVKERRIAVLEMQVSQLTKQVEEIKEKLLTALHAHTQQ